MNTTSPRSSLAKLGLYSKPKPFKVMVLGQSGVGKSALVVRFITRRYIGEYDPTLEKVYSFNTVIDSEVVYFEVLDSAGDPHESEYVSLEANIRWAEAFILMYSVTDKCSFDECHRLKFLINYNKRRRRLTAPSVTEGGADVPVVLVGNKTDLAGDRMVSVEEGQRRSREIGCVCFHEISVRESIDQVWGVFRDARRFWRLTNKSPRLRRAARADSELHPAALSCVLTAHAATLDYVAPLNISQGCSWLEVEFEEEEGSEAAESGLASRSSSTSSCSREGAPGDPAEAPFRSRASTDSHLDPCPRRSRHPPPAASPGPHAARRMSVSMRGNNTGSY